RPINNPLMPWDEAIHQPGSSQMQFGRRLIESRPMQSRIPDDSLIVPDDVATSVPGAGRYRFLATRDEPASFGMIYVPCGRPFTVRLSSLKAERIKAWWFDPRTGKSEAAGEYTGEASRRFTPPTIGEQLD